MRAREQTRMTWSPAVVSLAAMLGMLAADARGSEGQFGWETGLERAGGRRRRGRTPALVRWPRGSAGLSCGWRARPLSKPGARMRQQLVAFL